MRLIDQIVSADKTTIHCRAAPHFARNYPLRIEGTLFTATLVELGAQASAAHTSLFNIQENHTGLLIALSNVKMLCHEVGQTQSNLDVYASQLHFDANGAIYEFRIHDGQGDLLTGRAVLKMKEAKV